LEHAAEKDYREKGEDNEVNIAAPQDFRVGMHQIVQQYAEQKRRSHARRLNRHGAIAQYNANNANRSRCVEAGKRTIGKIAVTKSGESKHAVAHGERDREGYGDKPAQKVIAQR
jgi:hypothetical protein